MKIIQKTTTFLIFTIGFIYNTSAQCVMCKAQAEAQYEENGSGINTGIIYIMVIPYIILLIVFRKQIIRFFKNWKNMK